MFFVVFLRIHISMQKIPRKIDQMSTWQNQIGCDAKNSKLDWTIVQFSSNNNNNCPTSNGFRKWDEWGGRFRVPVWSLPDSYHCRRLIDRQWHKCMRWRWMTTVKWQWDKKNEPGQEDKEMITVGANRLRREWLEKKKGFKLNVKLERG